MLYLLTFFLFLTTIIIHRILKALKKTESESRLGSQLPSECIGISFTLGFWDFPSRFAQAL